MKNGYDQFFRQAQKNVTRKSATSKASVVELRERLKQKKAKKPARKISWKLASFSFIGVVIAFAGLAYSNELEKILKKVEFSLMGRATASEVEAATVATENKGAQSKNGVVAANGTSSSDAAAVSSGKSDEASANKKEFTDDEINHFAKMNERKRELDAREEELNRMETELAAQKVELEKRISELDTTRRQISSVLDEKVKADDKKIDSLVQVYTNMKPQQAAKVFESMDEDLAIEILGRMKKKPAAEILNLIKAEKAQVLSEKYAGYKRH